MKRIMLVTSMVKGWLGLKGSALWSRFNPVILKLLKESIGFMVVILDIANQKIVDVARPIFGGRMVKKRLDSWYEFTLLAVKRNARSSWRLTSVVHQRIGKSSFAMKLRD